MRYSLFGSGCGCFSAPSCSEPAAHTDVRLRQSGLPAEARPQRPVLQRYCSLHSQSYDFRHSLPRRRRGRTQSLSHYAIDHARRRRGGHKHAVDRRSNKDAYKPALGSRVDDTLSTIPQKGPSLDMGSAKMVGFYGVLAAAVAAALAYQG